MQILNLSKSPYKNNKNDNVWTEFAMKLVTNSSPELQITDS